MKDAYGNEVEQDFGWTIERYNPYGGGNYDQSALPYQACKAFSWTPEKDVVATKEEAEAWAERATQGANRYWKARMA